MGVVCLKYVNRGRCCHWRHRSGLRFIVCLHCPATIPDVCSEKSTLSGTTLEGGGEVEGALAPPEFEGPERRAEGETDNPILIAPSESKS